MSGSRTQHVAAILQSWIGPALLVVIILFGGSSRPDQTSHLVLQALSALVLLFYLLPLSRLDWTQHRLTILGLISIGILWPFLQTLHLPAYIWSLLPKRDLIIEGWSLLSIEAGWGQPVSIDAERTRTATLGILPPLAVFIAIYLGTAKYTARSLLWKIPVLGALTSFVGVLQVLPTGNIQFQLHDADISGASGLFRNINHQATFCLMTLPFISALATSYRKSVSSEDLGQAVKVGIAALFGICVVGVLAAGSVAGYLLLLPVLAFSLLIYRDRDADKVGSVPVAITPTVLIIAAILLIATSPVLNGLGVTSFDNGPLARAGIWTTTLTIIADQFLLGTGLGTFEIAYRLYEDADIVTTTFVNHAHNEYLELIVELGLPALALMIVALAIWFRQFIKLWADTSDRYYMIRRAAAVATLVVLLHSLVDYPVRAPAIAGLSAACFALMAMPGRRGGQAEIDNSDVVRKHIRL
ncbi:MAG: O-antigen ligase family protein, partial [Henriciella sp.]